MAGGLPLSFDLVYDRALLAKARAEAAAYRYEEGRRLLAKAGSADGSADVRPDARAAFEDFRLALRFQSGYNDAAELLEKARALGSDRIAVGYFDSASQDADSLAFLALLRGDCESALFQAAQGRDLVRVGPLDGANILVSGQLLSFRIEEPRLRMRKESFHTEGQGRGTLTHYSRRASVSATVAYRAVDLENSLTLAARSLSDSIGESREWGTWEGDRAALPPRYSSLVQAGEGSAGEGSATDLMARLAARMDSAFAASFIRSR